jgi:hypothetical protein
MKMLVEFRPLKELELASKFSARNEDGLAAISDAIDWHRARWIAVDARQFRRPREVGEITPDTGRKYACLSQGRPGFKLDWKRFETFSRGIENLADEDRVIALEERGSRTRNEQHFCSFDPDRQVKLCRRGIKRVAVGARAKS